MSVLREILRHFRRSVFVIGSAWCAAYVIAVGAGVPPVPLFAVAMVLGVVLATLLGSDSREAVLRRLTRRPRRIMTPGDYKRLRELEAELGWEPSEPPATEAEQAPPTTVTGTITAVAGAFSATAALSGTGSLSAEARVVESGCECPAGTEATQVHVLGSADPVARYCLSCGKHRPAVTKANLHFAALARVGREFCPSYCPVCAERLTRRMNWRAGIPPDDVQWLEEGRRDDSES